MKGKGNRKDVAEFALYFNDNIFALHRELGDKIYQHGQYQFFRISDPKPRHIHKAPVRDRLVHHAIHRVLYPYFDQKFIFDSYSCRIDKGTHRALDRLDSFARKVSRNHTQAAWVLKCDMRKFFASIDHGVLKEILVKHMRDPDVLWLLDQIVDSFHAEGRHNTDLPLGNLTSQLLVNIYMNEFDHYMKRVLKVRYYIRYADDFVILHEDKKYLEDIIPKISSFLHDKLKLTHHTKRVFITSYYSGIDFLGWVHFSFNRTLRTATKRRVLKKLADSPSEETIASYSGLLEHGNTYKIQQKIQRILLNHSLSAS